MAQAARIFTDQIGRQVTVPDTVDRVVVVLQHQTLNLLVQMNATDKIVGVMANWKQQLGDDYARLAPELTTYGSRKYTGLMMVHAGALNVAASTVKWF